jgi:hypothetical protein
VLLTALDEVFVDDSVDVEDEPPAEYIEPA